jgi:hypothetical protein
MQLTEISQHRRDEIQVALGCVTVEDQIASIAGLILKAEDDEKARCLRLMVHFAKMVDNLTHRQNEAMGELYRMAHAGDDIVQAG